LGVCLYVIQNESNSNDGTSIPHPLREHQQALNPKSGRLEIVYVDLQKVYPNREDPMSVEFSFEELRARHRGWLDMDWSAIRREEQKQIEKSVEAPAEKLPKTGAPSAPREREKASPKPQTVPLKGSVDDELDVNNENLPPSRVDSDKAKAARRARREERANRTRKIKVMEVKEVRGETQTSESRTCICGDEN
jgi:checkpoint serine/threonine-protein kinase